MIVKQLKIAVKVEQAVIRSGFQKERNSNKINEKNAELCDAFVILFKQDISQERSEAVLDNIVVGSGRRFCCWKHIHWRRLARLQDLTLEERKAKNKQSN